MSPLKVQYAIACLGRLQAKDPTEHIIAKNAGIPMEECMDITQRLKNAGLVQVSSQGVLELVEKDCTSWRVLNALWGPKPLPEFQALYGRSKGNAAFLKKWLQRGLFTLLVMAGLSVTALAVNPDTMVVSVTPSVTYSVSIASPMVQGYRFGTVGLGLTTISTVAIVVTNNGNVAEYFSLALTDSSPDNWNVVSGVPAADEMRMLAHFNATQPESGTFTDALTNSVPGAAAALYGQASTKTNATNSQNLWLRLTMPASITGAGGEQTMTLTINGQNL